MAVTA